MKTENKILLKKTKQSRVSGFQKVFLFVLFLAISFKVLPAIVVLFLGLLPTLTIVVTDTKNINKITTVGCFNISGVMICLNNLFNQITAVSKFSITDNIFNIIIMLSGAAVGVVLYYILPDIFVYIFKNSAQHRLKLINAKLEKLKSNWDNLIPEQR
ncbi:MAG: hypothetical protein E7004_01135 [Alphaproteobacteria bacterium]|nr:hypothetical protein [Alphaproteobacteria bacterium]